MAPPRRVADPVCMDESSVAGESGVCGFDAAFLRALRDRELVVDYQPIVDVRRGKARRCEALVRWQHPERGLVPPCAFLPEVQARGFMPALTRYVLAEAITACAAWRRTAPDVGVAINVDATDFADPDLAGHLTGLLRAHDLPPGAVQLEITERGLLHDERATLQAIDAVVALGVTLAIDDFGAGHGSLLRLRRLPVTELKIDRSFTTGIGIHAADDHIVRCLVELARGLDVAVVLEGVEHARQWHLATAWGVSAVQGFLCGRPMRAHAVAEFVASREWLSSAGGVHALVERVGVGGGA
jgi:EAL domain-containing protein (putative c-di-GMP-specific phosphodiesterase class I)